MEHKDVIRDRIVSPSLYAADFMDMKGEVEKIRDSGADWIHIDVMDGHFVAPVNFGQKLVSQLKSSTPLPLDVHLMVENPSACLDSFIEEGADYLTFHYEAERECSELLRHIRRKGVKAGLSLSPRTPVCSIYPLLPYCDLVLIMTIEPGTAGHQLDKENLRKVTSLRNYRGENSLNFLISVDGGVNESNRDAVGEADPDVVVIGSAFFQSSDPSEITGLMKNRDEHSHRGHLWV